MQTINYITLCMPEKSRGTVEANRHHVWDHPFLVLCWFSTPFKWSVRCSEGGGGTWWETTDGMSSWYHVMKTSFRWYASIACSEGIKIISLRQKAWKLELHCWCYDGEEEHNKSMEIIPLNLHNSSFSNKATSRLKGLSSFLPGSLLVKHQLLILVGDIEVGWWPSMHTIIMVTWEQAKSG